MQTEAWDCAMFFCTTHAKTSEATFMTYWGVVAYPRGNQLTNSKLIMANIIYPIRLTTLYIHICTMFHPKVIAKSLHIRGSEMEGSIQFVLSSPSAGT